MYEICKLACRQFVARKKRMLYCSIHIEINWLFFCLHHSLGLGKFFILVGISIFDTFFSSNRRYKEEVEILQLLLTYSHFQADFHRFQFTGNCESFARDIFRLPVALRKVSFFPACLIFFCFLFIIPLDLCLLWCCLFCKYSQIVFMNFSFFF